METPATVVVSPTNALLSFLKKSSITLRALHIISLVQKLQLTQEIQYTDRQKVWSF